MPTTTFFNLPAEKRENIVEAAIKEFAENTYEAASVARIIERAGIPRGSFYQYFADLKDLYKYIIELAGEKKMGYFSAVTSRMEELDFFEIVRGIYRAGIRFAREHPELAVIGNNLFRQNEELKKEIMGDLEIKSAAFFRELLKKGQEKGEIDPEADIEAAFFMLFHLNVATVDYVFNKRQKSVFNDGGDELLKLAEKILYIMENGLRNNKGD